MGKLETYILVAKAFVGFVLLVIGLAIPLAIACR